ncbi:MULTISPECIES: hypothetical protein [Nocardiopsis]|uniref:Uncharacterized protein n=1 Tax=Nocardiopsis sinuspersici TaxID=501010 RepID=A0A1V3C743_9ACTN|nr:MULTISPECIES: hypothetical protein [Nocardiopsis]OOC56587.1 hypothetical protein NOSIN_24435 [Nocardiopsis sinuspersici]
MNPEAPGLWARVLVRALVTTAAGVMALGFLGPGAAALVTALAVLTFVLLWLRSRTPWPMDAEPGSGASRGPERRPLDGG